ncbi:MAG: hypothetical protein ACRDZO_20475 [Egibacteraceae bacterium]
MAPDGGATRQLVFEAKRQMSPRGAEVVADQLRIHLARQGDTGVLVASWISPRAQEVLRGKGIGFIDLTGNIELTLDRPGLAIRMQGASRDPDPKPALVPSLKGPRAWALMRTLVEVQPPYGVRELAAATNVDPGYISRILRVLEEDLLISRRPRGPVVNVDWQALVRHIATTYTLFDANRTTTYVAAAGAERFLADLGANPPARWAITGSFGSSTLAPVAAPTLAIVYTDTPDAVETGAGILPADAGANVVLVRPYDAIAFSRTWAKNNLRFASVAQLALDCLTGSGRMPAEGEALLGWMSEHERRWRATTLEAERNPVLSQ